MWLKAAETAYRLAARRELKYSIENMARRNNICNHLSAASQRPGGESEEAEIWRENGCIVSRKYRIREVIEDEE